MGADDDGLLDISGSGWAGDEESRPGRLAHFSAHQGKGFLHRVHEPRSPHDAEVRLGQQRGHLGLGGRGKQERRARLGNGAEAASIASRGWFSGHWW